MKLLKQFLCLSLLLLLGCKSKKNDYKFLFVGHSYDWEDATGRSIDPRLMKIPVSDYDGFWFGGDICAETSLNPQTINKLDRHFNLKNPNSHIVLGNHDYRNHNHELYSDATGRPSFYTSTLDNMVVSVLNTNLNSSDCENLNAQFRMLQNVTDTLHEASHYILLMHHQIFPPFNGMRNFKSNGFNDHYSMNCDKASSSFKELIYPQLVDLEEKGIEVVVVIGDTGWNKGASSETNEGVSFLASGINNSYNKLKKVPFIDKNQDRVLEFKLDVKANTLTWEFVILNELIGVDKDKWLAIE